MKRLGDDLALGLVVLILVCALVFLIVPMVISAGMSFDARPYLAPFPPPELSSQWYERFFSNRYLLRGLKTSIILALSAAAISTVIGVMTAFAIDRYEFAGKNALTAFFLSPLVVPGVVFGFALLIFLSVVGIFDGFVRLLAGHVVITVPYTIRTTLSGLTGIKPSLTEAALSLGATERRAFWDITFPLAKTGIVTGAVFAFAISMDDVAVSLFLTDPSTYTLPVALVSMIKTSFDLTIAAAAVLLILFTILLILVLDRLVGLNKLIGQGIYRG